MCCAHRAAGSCANMLPPRSAAACIGCKSVGNMRSPVLSRDRPTPGKEMADIKPHHVDRRAAREALRHPLRLHPNRRPWVHERQQRSRHQRSCAVNAAVPVACRGDVSRDTRRQLDPLAERRVESATFEAAALGRAEIEVAHEHGSAGVQRLQMLSSTLAQHNHESPHALMTVPMWLGTSPSSAPTCRAPSASRWLRPALAIWRHCVVLAQMQLCASRQRRRWQRRLRAARRGGRGGNCPPPAAHRSIRRQGRRRDVKQEVSPNTDPRLFATPPTPWAAPPGGSVPCKAPLARGQSQAALPKPRPHTRAHRLTGRHEKHTHYKPRRAPWAIESREGAANITNIEQRNGRDHRRASCCRHDSDSRHLATRRGPTHDTRSQLVACGTHLCRGVHNHRGAA